MAIGTHVRAAVSPPRLYICVVGALALLLSAPVGSASAETKVACVGDSITALPTSWCGNLSQKLGAGYEVSNFGVSGTNLLKDIGQPYWRSNQFAPSHDFLPNIVIIMLGTNDGVPRVWAGKDHFIEDYEALIDSYESLSSTPRVYLNTPPPAGTGPFGHSGEIIANEVVPMVREVGMSKMVTVIDIFTTFGGADFDESLFGGFDQIHPNAEGQLLISDTVYEVLVSSGGLEGDDGKSGGDDEAMTEDAANGGDGMMTEDAANQGAGMMPAAPTNTGGAMMPSGAANMTGGAMMPGAAPNTGGDGMASGLGSPGSGIGPMMPGAAPSAGSASVGATGVGTAGTVASADGNASSGVSGTDSSGAAPPSDASAGNSSGGCGVSMHPSSKGTPEVALLLMLAGIVLRSSGRNQSRGRRLRTQGNAEVVAKKEAAR